MKNPKKKGFLGFLKFWQSDYIEEDVYETVNDYKDEDVYETVIKYKTVMHWKFHLKNWKVSIK